MMYLNQMVMLFTLNLHSVVCQLYFNKTGRKKMKNKIGVKKMFEKLWEWTVLFLFELN